MVDAKEGDAYVVDLRVADDYTTSESWNRYIVDTGVPSDIMAESNRATDKPATGGGPRAGLYRALFDQDIFTHDSINGIIRPWLDGRTPRICGIIITHTDRDHWGNAPWLARYLEWAHQKYKGTFSLNPLPIYTSPMIEWAKDIADISKLQVMNGKEKEVEETSAKEAAAKEKAKAFLTKEYGIEFKNRQKKLRPESSAGDQLAMEEEVKEEVTIDDTPFEDPTAWSAAFAEYKKLQQRLLIEKPYCSLNVGRAKSLRNKDDRIRWQKRMSAEDRKQLRNDQNAWIIEYFVRWVHKKFKRTVGCSFNSIYDLAKALGYGIEYRFNLQDGTANVKDLDLKMLMRPLTDAWIKDNTTSAITTWTERPIFKPTIEQLKGAGAMGLMNAEEPNEEVFVIAELRLVPPGRTAKRSYTVGKGDANSMLAGRWLRMIAKHRFVEAGVDELEIDTVAVEQINTAQQELQVLGLDEKLTEEKDLDDDAYKANQPTTVEEMVTRTLKLVVQGWFKEPTPEPDKLVQDVVCLGLQDTVYGLHFDLKQQSDGTRAHSFWKSTYSGCAGTRFSRDFLHLAAQAYLSPDQTDHWAEKAESNSEMLEEKRKDNEYFYYIELRRLINSVKSRKTLSKDVKSKLEKYLKDKLQPLIKEATTKFDLNKKNRDDKATKLVNKAARRHPSWGHAANRASLVTHFQFDAQTPEGNGYRKKFDMLFTGDAFEIGAGESQPYAPHLRPTNKDFAYPSAVRPKTIEMQSGLFANPDGNLLSWLWQNGHFNSMRVGVLKVPHHGSSNTTNALFYRLVSASVYLISGANKPHGHPRPETLQAIIDTIMKEDGPATPPKDYCSVGSIKKFEDKRELRGKVKDLPPIRNVSIISTGSYTHSTSTNMIVAAASSHDFLNTLYM